MLHVIVPVKDSIETAEETLRALAAAPLSVPHEVRIYNDFSTPQTTARLTQLAAELGFRLINLSDLTTHPSPNYLLVLQRERHAVLSEGAEGLGMLIVESDVTVKNDTLQRLYDGALSEENCGLAAAVTVDEAGDINYPYDYARELAANSAVDCAKHLSFCCTLLTPELLRRVDFDALDASKNWFDVTISHESRRLGLRNVLFTSLPVLHRPHQSRPWKKLKYENRLKYYWLKFTKGLDKI